MGERSSSSLPRERSPVSTPLHQAVPTMANEVDARSAGDCSVAHGATVEVRRQTDDDTRRLKEMAG